MRKIQTSAHLEGRTLLNMISVCAASTRKSLQGLDFISSQAFDNLANVVERLGGHIMGVSCTMEQKERLKSAKRYLKSDYKVRQSQLLTLELSIFSF